MKQRGSPLGESFFMPKKCIFLELSADEGVFFFGIVASEKMVCYN